MWKNKEANMAGVNVRRGVRPNEMCEQQGSGETLVRQTLKANVRWPEVGVKSW